METSTGFAWALVLGSSLLSGCGGKSFESDPNQGGSNQGGSSPQAGSSQGGSSQGGSSPQAGSAHGGSVGKAGSSPGGAGQGGSGGSTCEAFDDQPGHYIPVEIHNQTTTPIYLGQAEQTCGEDPLYDIADGDGTPLARPALCTQACQEVRKSGPVGCPTACLFPNTVALQPGEVLFTSWDGLSLRKVELPPKCLVEPDYGNACQQALAIQPGTFTFSARAGRSIDCSPSGVGMCQACTPSGEGGCTTPASLIAGEQLAASTTVLLDAAYGVYGSRPAPAGAGPSPGGSDAPSGAAPINYAVQIIFSN